MSMKSVFAFLQIVEPRYKYHSIQELTFFEPV